LAQHEESFVGVEGDFEVVVERAAVVDPAVGAFDHPAAWLDDEPAAGLWPRYDVNGDVDLAATSATFWPV